MESDIWKQNILLTELKNQPQLFEFYQAVRIIEHQQQIDSKTCRFSVGYHHPVSQEIIRFKNNLSLSFASSAIQEISLDKKSQYIITSTFLGLAGQNSVLPINYTELLLQLNQTKDYALKDYYDMFNHRIVSLFYRAWEKNHFYVSYERYRRKASTSHNLQKAQYSLLGYPKKPKKLTNLEMLTQYISIMYSKTRNSDNLVTIIKDYFDLPCHIKPFQPEFYTLPKEQLTRLSNNSDFNTLNNSAILGKTMRSIQNKFTIIIGPLDYQQFLSLLPNQKNIAKLFKLVRCYLGLELNFNVILQVKVQKGLSCKLSTNKPSRLGWNSWLKIKSTQQYCTINSPKPTDYLLT